MKASPLITSANLAFVAGLISLSAAANPPGYEPGEELAGGDTTISDTGRNAFSYPAANLSVDRQTPFFIGNSFFKKNWVEAPASTTGRDGLGPHFIARACAGCHAMDGRGAPPAQAGGAQSEAPVGLLLRLSIPTPEGQSPGKGGVVPEPTYGGQLDNLAVTGVAPEADVLIEYTELPGTFADGATYSLRKPTYRLENPAYGPFHPATLVSPRVAPQVIGLGLLEAIRETDLHAIAKRQAEEGLVSGRPNRVWDASRNDWVVGRFGWKANVGTVAHQTAGAFNGDIGITSPLFPHEECMPAQADCLARAAREAEWRQKRNEGVVDIDEQALARTIYYTSTLAVPARRDARDPTVLRGKQLFNAVGCANCHVPRHVTGDLADYPELSRQTIYPYTDLLLHDMGEGLADGRPDFEADGREWRTPPLWGIGLIRTVNGHTYYLHDGRARNLLEAVLWHGGEAETARQAVLGFAKGDREALVRFLESL